VKSCHSGQKFSDNRDHHARIWMSDNLNQSGIIGKQIYFITIKKRPWQGRCSWIYRLDPEGFLIERIGAAGYTTTDLQFDKRSLGQAASGQDCQWYCWELVGGGKMC